MENEVKRGLVELIQDADTESDVKALVARGKSEYKSASAKTVRRWDRWAQRRIKQLTTPTPTVVSTSQVEVKSEKKKFVKKK